MLGHQRYSAHNCCSSMSLCQMDVHKGNQAHFLVLNTQELMDITQQFKLKYIASSNRHGKFNMFRQDIIIKKFCFLNVILSRSQAFNTFEQHKPSFKREAGATANQDHFLPTFIPWNSFPCDHWIIQSTDAKERQ